MKRVLRTVVLVAAAGLGAVGPSACAKDSAPPADSSATDSSAPDSSAPDSSATGSVGSGSTSAVAPGDTSRSRAAAPAPGRGATGARPTPGATDGVSVATGVFTVAQAARGQEVYTASCALCHTMAQHSGTGFAAAWNGRRLVDLYEIIRGTMPLDNPGGLSDQEYIDVVAYMLQLNGVPHGKAPLRADAAALRNLRIEVKPAAGSD